jgi:hypothetical protein
VGRLACGLPSGESPRKTAARGPAVHSDCSRCGPSGTDPRVESLCGRWTGPGRRARAPLPGRRRAGSAHRPDARAGGPRAGAGTASGAARARVPGRGRGRARRVSRRPAGTARARLWDLREHHRRGRAPHRRAPPGAVRAGRDRDLDAGDRRAGPDPLHSRVVPGGRVRRALVRPDPPDDRLGRDAPLGGATSPRPPRPAPLHLPPAGAAADGPGAPGPGARSGYGAGGSEGGARGRRKNSIARRSAITTRAATKSDR